MTPSTPSPHRAPTVGATAVSAPTPTAYHFEWFPAHVKLPGAEAVRVAKVYATPEGLYVYNRAPRQEDRPLGANPHWWSPILYGETPTPPTGYAARNAGIALLTEAGRVHVTPLPGCGCSYGALKAWRPHWATRNTPWKATP